MILRKRFQKGLMDVTGWQASNRYVVSAPWCKGGGYGQLSDGRAVPGRKGGGGQRIQVIQYARDARALARAHSSVR
eukprot:1348330-Pleurochrysis_carterae.AAC.1